MKAFFIIPFSNVFFFFLTGSILTVDTVYSEPQVSPPNQALTLQPCQSYYFQSFKFSEVAPTASRYDFIGSFEMCQQADTNAPNLIQKASLKVFYSENLMNKKSSSLLSSNLQRSSATFVGEKKFMSALGATHIGSSNDETQISLSFADDTKVQLAFLVDGQLNPDRSGLYLNGKIYSKIDVLQGDKKKFWNSIPQWLKNNQIKNFIKTH